MKAGDRVMTPHGVGTVVHFECYAPLSGNNSPEPEYWDEADPNIPKGWHVRVGVKDCHPMWDIAYYPLDRVWPVAQN